MGDTAKDLSVSVGKIHPGHYTLEHFAQALRDIFKIYKYNLATEINTSFGQLIITNLGTKPITRDCEFAWCWP